MLCLLFLLSASADDVLERARALIQSMAGRLEQYVCIETVNRSYFRRDTPACEGTPAGERTLESADRLRLEVAVSESRELHSWPGATGFDTRDVDELIRDGPVATGSFGGYLASIFGHPGVTFKFLGEHDGLFEYGYHVPLQASRYELKIAGAWRPVAYEGEFRLDPRSLNLQRLTIRATDVPRDAPFCRASTTLDYETTRLGTRDVLLPRASQLDIANRSGRETTNETTFANCREYQAESEVVFDLPATGEAATTTRSPRPRLSLPLGIPVTLALEAPIDSATAATGDPIAAKVVKPVRRPGAESDLIPAGAIVRGRIRRVEHHLFPRPYFLIAIAFNRIDIDGAPAAFAARSEPDPHLAKELNANLAIHAAGIWFWDVGTFLIPTTKSRYVLPAGFESKWFTLATGR